MASNAIESEVKRTEDGKFIVPPKSPGRPKGSRNKLGEAFLSDMLEAWEEKGAIAIEKMIEDKPGDFVKVVASILPKQAELTVKDHSELSEEELRDRIQHLAERLGPFLTDRTGSADNGVAGKAIEAKPAKVRTAH